jgi:hypothetical protein
MGEIQGDCREVQNRAETGSGCNSANVRNRDAQSLKMRNTRNHSHLWLELPNGTASAICL